MRDVYTGDPVIVLDPKTETDWITASFRVWGEGSYTLRISSVNHDPGSVGRLFHGRLQVRIADPSQNLVLDNVYDAGSTGHRAPSNYGENELGTFVFEDWPLRSWTLRARVLKGDPNFITGRTEVRLLKHRYDPGMGGLMNYAMIVPGGILLVIAFVLSVPLARSGTWGPCAATALALVTFLALLA